MGSYLTFQRPEPADFMIEHNTHLFSNFAKFSERYTHIATKNNIAQMLLNVPFTVFESLFAAIELVAIVVETIIHLPLLLLPTTYKSGKRLFIQDHGKLALSAFLRLFAPLQILTGAPLRFEYKQFKNGSINSRSFESTSISRFAVPVNIQGTSISQTKFKSIVMNHLKKKYPEAQSISIKDLKVFYQRKAVFGSHMVNTSYKATITSDHKEPETIDGEIYVDLGESTIN